ncbi:MAG: methionyl-tRNA formyltransferase [Alphaproteobacteria bacterium]|nr:methionyl-tRNA formyltransferase [Alphaproteobacteria bacterium]
MSPLRLIFMGTPQFSVPTLQTLLESPHKVVAIYTQPPRPSGRGHHVQMSAIHHLAAQHNIPVFTPSNFKDQQEQDLFASHKADCAIVVAYGLILPKEILNIPRLGCLNVHASLLPRWRGAGPIQRAIEAGDNETGITIMKMETGLDTGPILLKKAYPLIPEETASHLHDALSNMGGPLLLEALEAYAQGTLIPTPQPTEGVTYASKLTRDEGKIDWRLDASVLMRKIKAFTPWPGVWFDYYDTRIKILAAEVVPALSGEPGTVLNEHLCIACGQGALQIKTLQRPGGEVLESDAFLRGFPIPVGTKLPCPVIN